MKLREGLGFRHLPPLEQQAYRIIVRAFSSMAASLDVSQVDRSVDLFKIIHAVLDDNPSIIYFNKTRLRIVESIWGRQVNLTGIPPRAQVVKMNQELERKANEIAASIRASAGDDYSQLIAAYEFLQSNVSYDHQEALSRSDRGSNNPVTHNAYGALISGSAVCDGFSSAFALLAQKLGFECMNVSGRSTHSSAGTVEHAWNIIRVGDRYYHMDVTWDANQCCQLGEPAYDYFALTDEEIAFDHDWNLNATPACSYNDLSYFIRNGLYAGNMMQLSEIIRVSAKNHVIPIRVKVSCNIFLPSDPGDYLAQMVVNEAGKTGKSVEINYTWNEHTRCFFAKFHK